MTKADIVEEIAARTKLNKKESFVVVDLIIENIKNTLAEGKKIEIRGFGSFKVKQRGERMARNPRTGEAVHVPAKLVPYFKPSKLLKERING
ncbi:MAG: integration host factor subunit beta [Candidatus Latescibacteria bacterium]|nr:integration host factor subunit beta [bacterium]MBD3423444.1 integration host factor subunit beta [Candidatus Latescibacterota bacterium]